MGSESLELRVEGLGLRVEGLGLRVEGLGLRVKRFAVGFLLGAMCLVQGVRAEGPATRLDVDSQPQGVAVFVDGRDRGTTPISIFDLTPGRHHLRCRLSGYEERDRFFTLEEGRPLSRNVVMEPVKGLLLVKSEPSGCNIAVDGVSVGVTPRLITTLDAKDVHQVTLRKAGYRPSTFEVRFSGRTPIVRNETMILDSGVIDIMSEPAGVEVTVNGIVRGKTPLKVADVPKGRATVRFRLEGFAEELRELSMNAGDRQTLSIAMKGLPGTLSLTSLPPGARFYVNGDAVGKSPVVLHDLAPGDYDVRAELEGYGPLARKVSLTNGASAREEFRLSNVMGRLEVRTSPPGAQVLIDGKAVGVTRSDDPNAEFSDVLAVENLMEGDHVLLVRREGYAESVRHPKIRTEKTSQANVRLRRVLTPDVRVTTDQGRFDGVLIANERDYVTVEVKLGVQRSFPRSEIRKIEVLGADRR